MSAGCTGKRSRGEYVKLSEFGEKQLLSDVGFLQEVGRENESALRRRPRPAPYHLPYRLQTLCREVFLHLSGCCHVQNFGPHKPCSSGHVSVLQSEMHVWGGMGAKG